MDIGFIGTGNMGGALIRGYAKSAKDKGIFIYDKDPGQIKKFDGLDGVSAASDLTDLLEKSNIIVLAVKPDIFEILLPDIKSVLEDSGHPGEKVFVSIAAGISMGYIKNILGADTPVIRAMPNLNSMVGQGMTAVCRDDLAGDTEFAAVIDLFNSVGKSAEVDENMIDTVIGVSGSSPAYAFMYIDALIKCAVKNGMEEEDALIFAAQSTLGAAVTVMESGIDPETLTKNVCSPGGTTIEAVNTLNELGFREIIEKGMTSAINKSKKMTK